MFLLAATLAEQAGRLPAEAEAAHLATLQHLAVAVQKVLALVKGTDVEISRGIWRRVQGKFVLSVTH